MLLDTGKILLVGSSFFFDFLIVSVSEAPRSNYISLTTHERILLTTKR